MRASMLATMLLLATIQVPCRADVIPSDGSRRPPATEPAREPPPSRPGPAAIAAIAITIAIVIGLILRRDRPAPAPA